MPITRREFVRATVAGALAAGVGSCRDPSPRNASQPTAPPGEWVNDVHSQLNRTRVAGIARPRTREQLVELVEVAYRRDESISLCGGRHAGGGQQFRSERRLVDLSDLNRVLAFDPAAGTIEVESGIRWPAVLQFLHDQPPAVQPDGDQPARQCAIHQKQGGADDLSLGGAIASNVHGRCLASRPIVQDIVAMQLITPDGQLVVCDRRSDGERFTHVVGGYGLFGVVYSVTFKLIRRRKLVRRVQWIPASEAIATLEARRDAGAWHGDFQFAVDERQPDFCAAGLCSWYEPVSDDAPLTAPSHDTVARQFRELVALAHEDKARALAMYREMTLAQDGKVVDWSDTWQHGDYVPGYHASIDGRGHSPGSEILSELYVPRGELAGFLAAAATILRDSEANLIYGTVRLIERDDETALPWAKRDYACVIFNLHTRLTAADIDANAEVFRRLLDAAIALDGSYYLTYHRFARPDQTMRCYPQFGQFFAAKRHYDSRETLDSDWYRHYRGVLGA